MFIMRPARSVSQMWNHKRQTVTSSTDATFVRGPLGNRIKITLGGVLNSAVGGVKVTPPAGINGDFDFRVKTVYSGLNSGAGGSTIDIQVYKDATHRAFIAARYLSGHYYTRIYVTGTGSYDNSTLRDGSFGASGTLWLRLLRAGNDYSGYFSVDGVNWTQEGATRTDSSISPIAFHDFVANANGANKSTCVAEFWYQGGRL